MWGKWWFYQGCHFWQIPQVCPLLSGVAAMLKRIDFRWTWAEVGRPGSRSLDFIIFLFFLNIYIYYITRVFSQDDCCSLNLSWVNGNSCWVRSGPEDMKFAIKSAKSMGLSKVQLESASWAQLSASDIFRYLQNGWKITEHCGLTGGENGQILSVYHEKIINHGIWGRHFWTKICICTPQMFYRDVFSFLSAEAFT